MFIRCDFTNYMELNVVQISVAFLSNDITNTNYSLLSQGVVYSYLCSTLHNRQGD